jgi:hypothetical protein
MKSVEEIEKAALHWWRMHRPIGWNYRRHVESPTVNCTTPDEMVDRGARAYWNLLQEPIGTRYDDMPEGNETIERCRVGVRAALEAALNG